MSNEKIEITALTTPDDNLSGKYIVEKARPLTIMQNMPFTLGELKILDTYLSRINARDPSRKTVRFSVEEYETLMDISRVRSERLSKTVEGLMTKLVTVADNNVPGQWNKFVLFSSSKCYKDARNQWYVELTCSEEASTLFFELSETGYFKYYLSSVTSLSSIYSYYMYLYFRKNEFRSRWEEDIDSLRAALCCKAELYNDFRYFKNRILEKSLKEVNEKTDIKYEYETVKKAQKVVAIRFKQKSGGLLSFGQQVPLNPDAISKNAPSKDKNIEAEEKYQDERVQFLAVALDNEFDESEMLVILDLLHVIMPFLQYGNSDRYDYLQKKYHELNLREKNLKEKGEQIKNRFAYLKTIIEADLPKT